MEQLRNHFTVIVAGDNPEELMAKYDINNKSIEPYVVMEISKAKEYHKQYIMMYEALVKTTDKNSTKYPLFKATLERYKNEDDIDFFLDITENYDIDEVTGNAITYENPDGKFLTHRLGKNLSLPLINKKGEEVFACRKKDVDWNKIHLNNKKPYEVAWDTVMEGKKPADENEELIYNNMKHRTEYFKQYENRENYVVSNTAFWGYAFLSEETGWVELNDGDPQFEWVINFYENFIVPLSEETMINVYECTR